MTEPMYRPMDLRADLPSTTTVLEASAGTGKTYTIAGLVTRYVAEGRARIDQVLAVTFGVAATSELRSRVRERLAIVRDVLADPTAAREHSDPVVKHLGDAPPDEVGRRRERLAAALADFDSATVATVHEFCQQVLTGLGVAADIDPHVKLVEDVDDIRDDVVADLFARHVSQLPHTESASKMLSLTTAREIGRLVVDDREARLLPDLDDVTAQSSAALRRRYADAVRDEVRRRTRAANVIGFDDLLARVRDALADPVLGPIARRRLQARFEVVLVDEFQDTDPVQWEVLRLAFDQQMPLVLIGDPKQAIYAFRGADLQAYLEAAAAADERRTLQKNWRSDPRVVSGVAQVFRKAALGDPRILVRPVKAGRRDVALLPEASEPVRLKILSSHGQPLTGRGLLDAPTARRLVAADAAAEVVRTLSGGLFVVRADGSHSSLVASDIAVLVPTHGTAQAMLDALREVNIECVFTGAKSVFASEAAQDWLTLLQGLDQPHRSASARRAALTVLVGRSVDEIDAAGSDGDDAMSTRLREWAEVLVDRGIDALFGRLSEDTRLAARLMGRIDGERVLTDLRHVLEIMHSQAMDEQLTLTGLLEWLRREIANAAEDKKQERARRLDTDQAAVQIATVHASKGLQYPVVLVPFGWDARAYRREDGCPRAHDERGRRAIHVGGAGSPGYSEMVQREFEEAAGEDLRLLYVAVTRAVSRVVLWWAPSTKTSKSPLHRLLAAADPTEEQPLDVGVPTDSRVAFERFGALAGDGLAVEVVEPAPGVRLETAAADGTSGALGVRVLGRELDEAWRRTSYSGLTRDAHELVARVGSEHDVRVVDDESISPDEPDNVPVAEPSPVEAADAALLEIPSPMADLEGGAAFGTLVHGVLEQVRFDPADPLGALTRAAHDVLRWQRSSVTADVLAAALLPSVTTPWGPVSDGLALADLAADDQLTELEFELPLSGGDIPSAAAGPVLGDVVGLLRAHLPAGDPVLPYADLLDDPLLRDQPLRGYLTGSLDLVVRVGGRAAPRYVVVDHKTNRLGPPDEPLTAWHYRRSALDDAVRQAHYPLQAMLYAVALHRFLRWRQVGYDPATHLGGVAYLFLRGMLGPSVPARPDGFVPGVWTWHPPASLVLALSDLLAGGAR